MNKRGRPLEFNRDISLEKALRLFWLHGYSAVSTDHLCSEMGLTKPSLYNSFKSKDDLYIECLHHYNLIYASKLIAVLDKHSNAAIGIEKMLLATAKQFVDTRYPRGCLAITGLIEVIGKSKKIDKQIKLVQINFISAFQNYFDKTLKLDKKLNKKLSQFVVGQLYAIAIFSKTNSELFDFNFFIKMTRKTVQRIIDDHSAK